MFWPQPHTHCTVIVSFKSGPQGSRVKDPWHKGAQDIPAHCIANHLSKLPIGDPIAVLDDVSGQALQPQPFLECQPTPTTWHIEPRRSPSPCNARATPPHPMCFRTINVNDDANTFIKPIDPLCLNLSNGLSEGTSI